jgi:hypothetical protein
LTIALIISPFGTSIQVQRFLSKSFLRQDESLCRGLVPGSAIKTI